MRCRTHPSDHGAGVCPCCLRERLSALTVAQVENKAKPSRAILSSRSDFPNVSDERQKRRAVKFSKNSSPKKAESDAIVLKSSGSNSSFLDLILGQWKKNKKKSPHIAPAAEDVSRGRSRKPHVQPVDGRGMSPAMKDETNKDERRISTPSPLKRKAQRPQSPNKLSSYAVCLSPMLRPSPGNRRNHGASEAVFAGDLQGTLNRKWSGAGVAVPDASSGQGLNRSRKLVDLGKAW
ncbi:hypothetical protein KFK09_029026 [Dendrobium nobile]|uniref:Uncharacterized protein n=1 Tax=Dendrobium nobile TaxID=94219 RepID=A0A8T3A3J4_DENNO|nr:hypothetical protein KFK09_029026 [Dendrobium nobile]